MSENLLKISITGDILCKKQLLESSKTSDGGYDFNSSFEKIKPLWADSDIVIGNLETPIINDKSNLVSHKTNFAAPKEFAEAVYNSGIHYVSTANNHALDRGIDGLNDTIEILDDIGFKHTGTFNDPARPSLIFEKNGIKFGMLSYTYGSNAHRNKNYIEESEEWRINLFQKQELSNKYLRYIFLNKMKNPLLRFLDIFYCLLHPQYLFRHVGERRQNDTFEMRKLKKDIEELDKEKCDFKIMCMHIGGQYNEKPSPYTKKMVRFLKSHGVNIIVGNHEHVVHGCDLSDAADNKFATYCLGNFLSSAGLLEEPYDKNAEYSVLCHIFIDPISKNIVKITFNILTTIQDAAGMLETVPAYDLYQSADSSEKERICKKMLYAAKKFSGSRTLYPSSEYTLYPSCS
ncbi:MAG: CapA family protein [Lachnospiraceae bacterium]|nr:CapA family protein [Lachnospiraceae bacterium]